MQEILVPAEVHVWTAFTNVDVFDRNWRETLSPEEREKAERFSSERHRQNYIFAHAVLRDILGRYLMRSARNVLFKYDAFGKPLLVHSETQVPLYFNLSHSGSMVLVALAYGRHIGADVEEVRPLEDIEHIATAYFTTQERAFVLSRDSEERARAFFHCWTRKESYIKALGKGLLIPLNSFETCITAGMSGRMLPRSAERPEVESWWLTDVDVPAGYSGAMTVERGFERLMYFRWA